MTREQALENLKSNESEVRLEAARFFSSSATPDDLDFIREIEAKEPVPWIRRALRIASERVSAPVIEAEVQSEGILDPKITADVYSKALRDVSGRVLHEFGPLIGGLLITAPGEVENYTTSQTRRLLNHLSDLSEALRAMRTATSIPRFEEIELSTLISELIDLQQNTCGVQLIIAGPEDFMVSAGKSQLKIAISNGLRNAIEKYRTSPRDKAQVVVSWGATGKENWIFIKDNGGKLKFKPSELFKEGISSKDGHPGYGLSLVREAMASMDGEVLLQDEEDGVHFELRWFRKNENSAG